MKVITAMKEVLKVSKGLYFLNFPEVDIFQYVSTSSH